jgi:hypothetical protein
MSSKNSQAIYDEKDLPLRVFGLFGSMSARKYLFNDLCELSFAALLKLRELTSPNNTIIIASINVDFPDAFLPTM